MASGVPECPREESCGKSRPTASARLRKERHFDCMKHGHVGLFQAAGDIPYLGMKSGLFSERDTGRKGTKADRKDLKSWVLQ